MKLITTAVVGIAVTAALTLGAASAGHAQGKAPVRARPMSMSRPSSSAKPSTPANAAPKANGGDSFKGIATRLGTTSDALETAYQSAKQANPKLTRGQFVAANMVAHNLGSKNPAITTQAILSGLQSGKSLGQTLQGLGLSEKEAKEAEHQAKRDAAAAHGAMENPKPATP
jgi:hypothetical protein